MTRVARSRTLNAPEFRARVPVPATGAGFAVAGRTRAATRAPLAWRVIIADQSEARIYSTDGVVSHLKLLATVRNPSARTPEQRLLTGRGGSKMNRAAGVFQALAPVLRVHRQRNEQFGKAVAAVAGREMGTAVRLALVASPRLLGLIERALPSGVRAQLVRSIPRDVTHEAASRLRVRLQRELMQVASPP